LRHSKIDWHLSEEEMLEKRLAWAKNSIKDIKRIEARYFEENQYSVAVCKAAVIAGKKQSQSSFSTK
jgi:hypothetical protein